jgi:hypothetical protein
MANKFILLPWGNCRRMISLLLKEIFPEPRQRILALCIVVVFIAACIVPKPGAPRISGLQRRINFALPGAVLRIEPDDYHQMIQIRKSITLEPTEDARYAYPSSIVVDGNCQVTLRDIRTHAVHINGSAEVLLENVRVNSSKLCLSVSDQSRVTAVRCGFSGSISNGTSVTDQAQFRAEDCTWEGNLQAGIVASGSSVVELQRCFLTSNRKSGMVLENEAFATIDECRVSRTGDDASPTLLRSCSQWGTGIRVQGDAELYIERSTISGSARNGVEVADTATVNMQSTIITENGNRQAFEVIAEESVAQESTATGNYGLGVLISGDCDVSISDCEISSNLRGGIALRNAECINEQSQVENLSVARIQFVGTGNRIIPPGLPGGNLEFDCCPGTLCARD